MSTAELLSELKSAAAWVGMPKHRALTLLRSAESIMSRKPRTFRDVIFIAEVATIVDIYQLWCPRECDYPGILRKIREALESGPDLPDDEIRGKSHNHPRNSRFVYLIAGHLIVGGSAVVSIDGVSRRGVSCNETADILVRWNELEVPIQCKRPHDLKTLDRNVRRAGSQISRGGPDAEGIVAVDASRAVRPKYLAMPAPTENRALDAVENLIRTLIVPRVAAKVRPCVVGAVVFARVPTILLTAVSPLLHPLGMPIQHALPVRTDSWVTWKRPGARNADVVDAITTALKHAEA